MPLILDDSELSKLYEQELKLLELKAKGKAIFYLPIVCKKTGRRYETMDDYIKASKKLHGRYVLLNCSVAEDFCNNTTHRNPNNFVSNGYFIEVYTQLIRRDLRVGFHYFLDALYNKNLFAGLYRVRDHLKENVYISKLVLGKAGYEGIRLSKDEALVLIIKALKNADDEKALEMLEDFDGRPIDDVLDTVQEAFFKDYIRDYGEFQVYSQMLRYTEMVYEQMTTAEQTPTRRQLKNRIRGKYKYFVNKFYVKDDITRITLEDEVVKKK